MTIEIDEAIEMYTSNAEYERTHGNLQGCLEFKQLAEWLKDYKRLKEQSNVPDSNVRDIISRQAVLDLCKKEIDHISKNWQNYHSPSEAKSGFVYIATNIYELPSVKPQERTGHWVMRHRKVNTINYRTGEDVLTGEIHTVKELIRYETDEPYCACCGKRAEDISQDYCGYCGARMESEDKE